MRQHSPQPFIKHTLPIWPACLMSLCPRVCIAARPFNPITTPSIHLQVVAGVGAETPNYSVLNCQTEERQMERCEKNELLGPNFDA